MMVKEVKYRDVERTMIDAGWQVLRTSGSHEIWVGPDGKEKLSIPRHDKVTAGVVRQIIKTLPHTPDNWR